MLGVESQDLSKARDKLIYKVSMHTIEKTVNGHSRREIKSGKRNTSIDPDFSSHVGIPIG